MIQATDVRVGNWVNSSGGYCQLLEVKENILIFSFGGIELTSEILGKCGLEQTLGLTSRPPSKKQCKGYYLKGYALQIMENFDDDGMTLSFHYFGNYGESNEKEEICTFKYLHQLQNLYFALTGTELEFKP